jgi:hypothetical protein
MATANRVQKYIECFSEPGDLILDPYGGSGRLIRRNSPLCQEWATSPPGLVGVPHRRLDIGKPRVRNVGLG